MRVALVLAGYSRTPRGSQVLVRQLACGLRARGHRVHLVTYARARRRLPRRRRVHLEPSVARVVHDIGMTVRLWQLVRRGRCDVIHAHNYEAAIAGLIVGYLTGVPLVYHGHTVLAEELPMYFAHPLARRLAARLGAILDAQVPKRAAFCVAVTDELALRLRRAGVRPRDLVCVTPVGPPSDLRRQARTGRGLPTGGVCYAGNLDGYQNLAFLGRAFARVRRVVPEARLVVVTHAACPLAPPWVDAPLAGVELLTARTYDEVHDQLVAADVAVSPRAAGAGFPMKLLNYMAAGKAIVASAGSAKGLSDRVTARVVPDGDERAFAAAIVELLRRPEERLRLGAAARRLGQSPRAWERVLDRIEDVYRTVRPDRAAAERRMRAS